MPKPNPNNTPSLHQRLARIERLIAIQSFRALTVRDAALLLNLSESHLRHLVATRQIPHYRSARGNITFHRDQLEAWLLTLPCPTQELTTARAVTHTVLNPRHNS